MPQVPTSTQELRNLAKSSAASKALGSTQLNGCPGDFCGALPQSPFVCHPREKNALLLATFLVMRCFISFIIE